MRVCVVDVALGLVFLESREFVARGDVASLDEMFREPLALVERQVFVFGEEHFAAGFVVAFGED